MTLITKPDYTYVWASGGAVVAPNDTKKQLGWVAEAPPFQYDNWLQNRQDQMLAHINQRGIAAWDALTNYEAGGLSYVQGSDGKVYKSVAASGPSATVQNPTTDGTDTYWTVAFADVGAFLTQTAGDTRYTQRSNNLSDITNVATARTNLGAAPIASPTFTGTPTTPTPPQFDNDTSVASTAFVQRALGNVQTSSELAANTTLTAADVGKFFAFSGVESNLTITLPLAASCGGGSVLRFKNNSTFTQTLSRSGSDLIAGGQVTVENTFKLSPGSTVSLTTNGGGWIVIEGTADLPLTFMFSSSLIPNGYQRLPSGLIIQWGSFSVPSGISSFVYPITFPNGVFSVVLTPSGAYSTSTIESTQVITEITNSQVSVRNALCGDNTGTVQTVNVNLMILGH